jgi:hypothetical protein
MKRTLAAVLFLLASSALSPARGDEKKWWMSAGGSLDLLAHGYDTSLYYMGAGGEIGFGLIVAEDLSFWLNITNHYLLSNVTSFTTNGIQSVLSAKYTFAGYEMRPYIRAGAGGYSMVITNAGNISSESSFMAQAGIGAEFPIWDNLSLYSEVQGSIHFPPAGLRVDIPVDVGVIFEL